MSRSQIMYFLSFIFLKSAAVYLNNMCKLHSNNVAKMYFKQFSPADKQYEFYRTPLKCIPNDFLLSINKVKSFKRQ